MMKVMLEQTSCLYDTNPTIAQKIIITGTDSTYFAEFYF